MKKYLVSLFLLLTAATLSAQVSVNQDNATPDPSAMLDVKSSDKGMLIPRMTTAQRDGIATPAPGLIIYNTTDSCFNYYTGTNWYKDCGQKRDVLEGPLMPELLKAGKGNSVVNVKGIVADELGNAYVLGYFRDTLYWGQNVLVSEDNSDDIFVAKYTSDGNIAWVVNQILSYSFPDADEFAYSITTGNAGVPIIVGRFFVSGPGNVPFVAICNPNTGDINDLFNFDNGVTPWGVSVDNNDNSYVTGEFNDILHNIVANGPTFFLVKNDFTWVKTADAARGRGIHTDGAGNSYVTGYFEGTTAFDAFNLSSSGNHDVFVTKFDTDGNVLWAKKAGGTGLDEGYGISIDAAGNCYVTGLFEGTIDFGGLSLTSAGGRDIFLAKYATDGSIQWVKQGGGSGFGDAGLAVRTDNAGNSYITGKFVGTVTFGSQSLVSSGAEEVFVVKYDTDGNVIWANKGGGATTDIGAGIGVSPSGGGFVFTAGTIQGTATFGNTTLNGANGKSNGFVWPLSTTTGGSALEQNSNLSASQDLDPDPENELQTLGLSGATLSITDGNSVDLSGINTDNQTLNLAGTNLNISNGNSVDLVSLVNDNDWTLSGNNLYNANNGNVGIGTATPKQKLHVNGQYYGTGYFLLHAFTGDGNSGTAFIQAADDSGSSDINMRLRTQKNGALVENLYLSNDGNVGVGTATPSFKLSVNGTISGTGLRLPGSFDPDPAFIGTPGNFISFGHSGVSEDFIGYKNNSFFFKDSPGGGDTQDPNVIIDGKLGIGTAAPKQKLHVNGDYYGKGSLWLYSSGGDGTSGTAYVQARDDSGTSDIGLQLRSQNAGSVVNAVYVAPDGKVGVGTTDPGGRAFRVAGSSEQDGKVYYTSALRTAAFFGFDIVCWDEGGGKYEVGRVVSSRRYKENIQPFEPNAERLLDIQLKSWTGINDTTGTIGFGYIAEEVDSLGLKDLVLYNEAGQVESLKFSYFPFYNMEVIKKNRARIVALEDELSAVKQENAALKAQLAKQEAQTAAMEAAFEQRFQQLEAALQQLNNAADKSQGPNDK